jgi:probable rRNA maturation factor
MVLSRKSKLSFKHIVNVSLAPEAKKLPATSVAQWDLKSLKSRVSCALDLMCGSGVELNIRFCGDEEMAETNGTFRNKKVPTDVLSFPAMQAVPMVATPPCAVFLGDILVCLPVCRKQAKQHRVTLPHEIEKMVLHGIVHLKGFDHDRSESAWKVMSGLERVLHKELILELGKPEFVEIRERSGP